MKDRLDSLPRLGSTSRDPFFPNVSVHPFISENMQPVPVQGNLSPMTPIQYSHSQATSRAYKCTPPATRRKHAEKKSSARCLVYLRQLLGSVLISCFSYLLQRGSHWTASAQVFHAFALLVNMTGVISEHLRILQYIRPN